MNTKRRTLNQLRVRGQSQAEFLIIFSLAIFMVFILSVLYNAWNLTVTQTKQSFRAAEIANTVAFAINNAYFSGNGTGVNISIPSQEGLTIVIDEKTVTVNSSGAVSQSQIIAGPVDATRISSGQRFFYNRDGTIEVS